MKQIMSILSHDSRILSFGSLEEKAIFFAEEK